MATINGVEIRGLKSFVGREGIAYQGDVYLNGQKLGFWSQNGDGAIVDDYYFDKALLDKPFEDYKKGFPEDYEYLEYAGKESFLADLVFLAEIEKDCMKFFQGNCKSVVYMTDRSHCAYLGFPKKLTISEFLKYFPEEAAAMREEMPEIGYAAEVFTADPGQFDLIVDEDHPAPELFILE